MAGFKYLKRLTWEQEPIRAFEIAPDGRLVATLTGKAPYTLSVWEIASGKKLWSHPSPLHPNDAPTLGFSPDGRFLVHEKQIWSADEGEIVENILEPRMAFTHDMVRAVSYGGRQSYPYILDEAAGELKPLMEDGILACLLGPTAPVLGAAFTADGSRLVTADRAGKMYFWETQTWSPQVTLDVEGASALALSSAGHVAVGTESAAVRLWNAAGAAKTMSAPGPVQGLTFLPAPNLLWVLFGDESRAAQIWDIDKGESLTAINLGRRLVSFAAEPRVLLVADVDIHVWEWSETIAQSQPGPPLPPRITNRTDARGFATEMKSSLGPNPDVEVRIAEAGNGAVISVTTPEKTSLLFGDPSRGWLTPWPDGPCPLAHGHSFAATMPLVAAIEDAGIRIWNAMTGEPWWSLDILGVKAVALTPEVTHFVYADGSAVVALDLRTGQEAWRSPLQGNDLAGMRRHHAGRRCGHRRERLGPGLRQDAAGRERGLSPRRESHRSRGVQPHRAHRQGRNARRGQRENRHDEVLAADGQPAGLSQSRLADRRGDLQPDRLHGGAVGRAHHVSCRNGHADGCTGEGRSAASNRALSVRESSFPASPPRGGSCFTMLELELAPA